MALAASYALACKAVAHPRRVRIFQLLATDPGDGVSCLALRTALRMPETSLGHHLGVMTRCGLCVGGGAGCASWSS